MAYKKPAYKPESLREILEKVEETGNSAFLVNPPFHGKSRSILLSGAKTKLILTRDNVEEFFNKIESYKSSGYHVLVMVDYEAGLLFLPKLEDVLQRSKKKRFGSALVFKKSSAQLIDLEGVPFGFEGNRENMISDFLFDQTKEGYTGAVRSIKESIKKGDTYQINYTMSSSFNYSSSPPEIFSSLLFNQSSKYAAYINLGNRVILSLSPELFFSQKSNMIRVAPMKGTLKADLSTGASREKQARLSRNPKERAENLMITDLLRNDLHRICSTRPLRQISVCRVEKYETVYQLVSEIGGQIDKNIRLLDIFKALFPCGSVTGAPKISSMRIINGLEKRNRGLYTGSIGYLNGENATLNVAIRTLELDRENKTGKAGLGSGIVWDSVPENEYDECVIKGKFFTNPLPYYRIFETMLIDKGSIPLIELHKERMAQSAKVNLFCFSPGSFTKTILDALFDTDETKKYKLKILLGKYGDMESEVKELVPLPEENFAAFSGKRISSKNPFLYSKTTERALYDNEREIVEKEGLFDLIYLNEKDEVCEGGISNLFAKIDGKWHTPPVGCGLLEGIGRSLFMKKTGAIERVLYKEDISGAEEVVLTNAVRGPVRIDKITN
ncbi:MAG: chorismate-binding protein [Ignavibacteria bacterium]|nr:chorismate-binding protein [Ignavibacteria bacterium]